MKTIPLTQGKVTLVDDDVYEWASKFKWQALKTQQGRRFDAVRTTSLKLGKPQTLLLSREILELSPGDKRHAHHIDGNSLNNCCYNLQIVTCQQNNQAKRRLRLNRTSCFRGVSRCAARQKWQAHIMLSGRSIALGRFKKERDAARAYDTAAREFFGEFACPNFP